MRLITANIGRKATIQHTRADFETIRQLGGITGFQEIDEADKPNEHWLLSAVFNPKFNLYGMSHYVPVAVPKSFDVVNSRDVFGTDGVAHFSPSRWFTVVTVKTKRSAIDKLLKRNAKIFVVINTHYPAGGYHGDRPPAAKEELKRHWDQQFEKHKELVDHYASKDITVFWTGDSNRADMPKTHPREVQVVTAGIDNVCYTEGGVKVKVLRKGIHQLYSDHPALYADFKLS